MLDHRTSKGILKKKIIYFCFIDYTKVFVWITTNWRILEEIAISGHLTCLPRNLYAGQEATELDMEQCTASKLGKEYVKAIYVATLLI